MMIAPVKTSNPHPAEKATARVTLRMTPTEKENLVARVAEEGFDSVGEYLHCKAFDHDPDLDALVAKVQASAVRAVQSVTRSIELVDHRTSDTAEHGAKVRAEAALEFASWTPAQKRAVSGIFGGAI